MCIIFREHYLLLHILIVRAAPPLLQAVLDQDKPRIKELLKGLKRSGGAGEQQNDDKGRNALHYAAHTGNAEIVMLLLRTKPVPDPKQRDDFHWTPLHYAARSGCAKVRRECAVVVFYGF